MNLSNLWPGEISEIGDTASVNVFTVFYGEDINGMAGDFIDNAVITDPQGEFPFMVAHKRFTFPWIFLKGFYLGDNSQKRRRSALLRKSISEAASWENSME